MINRNIEILKFNIYAWKETLELHKVKCEDFSLFAPWIKGCLTKMINLSNIERENSFGKISYSKIEKVCDKMRLDDKQSKRKYEGLPIDYMQFVISFKVFNRYFKETLEHMKNITTELEEKVNKILTEMKKYNNFLEREILYE